MCGERVEGRLGWEETQVKGGGTRAWEGIWEVLTVRGIRVRHRETKCMEADRCSIPLPHLTLLFRCK